MAGARSRAAAPPRPLQRYQERRDFSKTPEPRGETGKRGAALAFVIQKHHATRLHYDFRLEFDGVMLSWAVPKGPSYDPTVKRMAVRTEDHPVSYNAFEGTTPHGQYGAGTVLVWDRGTWEPVGDPRAGLASGKLAFTLHGEKMQGLWELVHMGKPGRERQDPWLLFKKHDPFALNDVLRFRRGYEIEIGATNWPAVGFQGLRFRIAETGVHCPLAEPGWQIMQHLGVARRFALSRQMIAVQ